MLCEYSHTKTDSLAQIRTIMAEIQQFFYKGLFLLAHPVDVNMIYIKVFYSAMYV